MCEEQKSEVRSQKSEGLPRCEALWKCGGINWTPGVRCQERATRLVEGGGIRLLTCLYHSKQAAKEIRAARLVAKVTDLKEVKTPCQTSTG